MVKTVLPASLCFFLNVSTVDNSEYVNRISRRQGWPASFSLQALDWSCACNVCVLPRDSGPAISSPTSPTEGV